MLCKLSSQDSQHVLSLTRWPLIHADRLTRTVGLEENNIKASESGAFSVSLQQACGLLRRLQHWGQTKDFEHCRQALVLSPTSSLATFVFVVFLKIYYFVFVYGIGMRRSEENIYGDSGARSWVIRLVSTLPAEPSHRKSFLKTVVPPVLVASFIKARNQVFFNRLI